MACHRKVRSRENLFRILSKTKHVRTSFTPQADSDLTELEIDPARKKILASVRKALGYMEINLRHPSLQIHEYKTLRGSDGEKVFETYAQQNTPAAYRIFWYYGPNRNQLTIAAITPHP